MFQYLDLLAAGTSQDMDWHATAKDIIARRGQKRDHNEVSSLAEVQDFAVDYAEGTSAQEELDAGNILLQLPTEIQMKIGQAEPSDRAVMLNAYLNSKVFLLPRHDVEQILRCDGYWNKFMKLKELLDVRYQVDMTG